MKMRYLADLRSLAFVAAYYGLVIYQWLAGFGSPWLLVPLVAITCVMSFLCAVITHNTVHTPVFEERWANRVFQVLLSLSYGSAVSAFVPGHNLSHHRFTQSPRDVMRTTKVRHQSNMLNMMEFAPRVAIAIMQNDVAYSRAMKKRLPTWYVQYKLENYSVWAVTLALFVLDWKKALVFWLVPHLYAAWGIISMNYLQHDGCDQSHPYNHSRNFVGGVVNWLTFNNGFHSIHHDHPGMHWSLLPEAHAREIAPHIAPELDQRSMHVYIWRTFVWPGRRKTFDGRPLVLEPRVPDESWIPRPDETPEDLGAIASA
ncbi:MAG TPA: fatty acid desaturase [Polyangiaceae bacterium]|nr:fatty acid desaturase [Polyangiaceae bacterium]